GEAPRVFHGLGQVGLTVRGFHGEESEAVGNLFQVSNQVTLGRSERELVDFLDRLVGEVMGHESRARIALRRDAGAQIEDRDWLAWRLLVHARRLARHEHRSLRGDVRLGVARGFLPQVGWRTVNRLLIETQSGHLALASGGNVGEVDLPYLRAATVR